MLHITKKFLFHSILTVALVSFISMVLLYWYPIQTPLSLFLATNLIFAAYALKVYFLIPIGLSICILLFFTALSILKDQIALPSISCVYLLCDLLLLSYSFMDACFNDKHFILVQAVQIIISVVIIFFLCIYLILQRKTRKTRKTGDGSLS